MTPGTRTEPCNKIPYFVALPAVTSIVMADFERKSAMLN